MHGSKRSHRIVFIADSIENNIENAHGNVELGQQELQKAAEFQVNV
jgi:HD superfamily phosphohydrolase YqeK